MATNKAEQPCLHFRRSLDKYKAKPKTYLYLWKQSKYFHIKQKTHKVRRIEDLEKKSLLGIPKLPSIKEFGPLAHIKYLLLVNLLLIKTREVSIYL